MNFARIDKAGALLWISGALGLFAFMHLALTALGWTLLIPELGVKTTVFLHSRAFVIALVLSYVVYRIGAAPARSKATWYAWFSGFFGAEALKNLVLLALGLTLVIPQIEFVKDVTYNIAAVIIGGALSYYLWREAAKRSGAGVMAAKKKR